MMQNISNEESLLRFIGLSMYDNYYFNKYERIDSKNLVVGTADTT